MKNFFLKLLTAILFVGACFLTIEKTEKNGLSVIQKINAQVLTYKAYVGVCPNGNIIILCGEGGSGCIPQGTCAKT